MAANNFVTLDVTKIDGSNQPTFGLPQNSFNDLYMLSRPQETSLKSKAQRFCRSQNACSVRLFRRQILKWIPVLDWLPKYDVKDNLLSDLLGGITVGIMHIPQGMAYAILANMPSVVGLYVSFFSVLVYFFLGTSRHLSMGTFAVVSLMTGNIVNSYLAKQTPFMDGNQTLSHTTTTTDVAPTTESNSEWGSDTDALLPADDVVKLKVQIAAAVAFFVGLLQVVMSVMRLGSLSVYLSDTLVSGFTTGAAVHVFSSQIKYVFGIQIPSYGGVWALVYTYRDIVYSLHLTNPMALAISTGVIVSLVLVNDHVNGRFKDTMIMPIPMELFVIMISTCASYYVNLKENYSIQIVDNIPIGIPLPVLPPVQIIPGIATDCIALAIVSYCIPISLAKIFAKRNKYDIDSNQELFAYGAGNMVGSFFSCFPSCASLSRSSVQESSGAKTQVASIVSCCLVLVVLLFVAPLFEPVPICVLAGIIIVALRGMFRQVNDLKVAWRISRREGAIWLITFLAVVLLDVDLGLLVSIFFLLITILYRLQRPYVTELGNVPSTQLYLDVQKYKMSQPVNGMKILYFGGALFFANREYFKQECYKLAFNPVKKLQSRPSKAKDASLKVDNISTKISRDDLIADFEKCSFHSTETSDSSLSEMPLAVILDCSVMNFIDMAAVNMLSQLHSEYEEVGIELYLCACNDNVLMKMERAESFSRLRNTVFPTIHDAVMHLILRQTVNSKSSTGSSPMTHL